MKTKISIILIALMAGLMTLTTESATAQTIRKGGSVYCRINNGTIYNGSGSKIGEFKSGSIYNSSGSKVGEVRSGTIYKSGSEAGKVNSSGKVYDRSGSQIGEISSNGNIYNKSGSKIGEADHVDAGLAAAIILFDVLK